MEHKQYIEQMSAALDGELSPEERRALDRHLDQCPRCASLYARLSRHAAALRGLECDVPPGLREAIMDNLPPQMTGGRRAAIPWRRLGGLAACIALTVTAGVSALVLFGPRGGSASDSEPRDAGAVTADMAAPAEAPREGIAEYSLNEADEDAGWDDGGGESSKGVYTAPDYTETGRALQVDGHPVAAILTLSEPPADARADWPEGDILRLDGVCYYLTTGQVVDELLQWAQGREELTASLTGGPYAPDDRCAVRWTE